MYHKNPVIPIIIVPLFMASAVCAFGVTHLFQWLPRPRLARQFALCMVCHIVNYHSRGRADADYVELSRPGDRHFTHRAPRCCTAPQQDRVQVHRQAHRSYHAVLNRDPAASYHYVMSWSSTHLSSHLVSSRSSGSHDRAGLQLLVIAEFGDVSTPRNILLFHRGADKQTSQVAYFHAVPRVYPICLLMLLNARFDRRCQQLREARVYVSALIQTPLVPLSSTARTDAGTGCIQVTCRGSIEAEQVHGAEHDPATLEGHHSSTTRILVDRVVTTVVVRLSFYSAWMLSG